MSVVKVGADPEVFVKHLASRAIIPVCGLIGGTKEEPKEMEGLMKRDEEEGGYAYQEDGCAYEFNIPATTSGQRFSSNIEVAWGWIRDRLHKSGLDPQIRAEYN